MTPNGRRAWRRAAKKLRCKMGRRWRSQEEWVHGKRWSELVPDLAAHRGHICGPWFKRHGFQSLDQESSSRHYIGLWGTVDGDTIGFVEAARPFTSRSLVGMTMGARKRAAYYEALRSSYDGDGGPISNRKLRLCLRTALLTPEVLSDSVPLDYRLDVRAKYRIGQRLRPCPGCPECEHGKCWRCANCGTTKGLCDLTLAEVRCKCGKGCGLWRISFPATTVCNGSGVLPARHQLCLGCSWCGTPPKEDATRFTECDGSGVLPARRP